MSSLSNQSPVFTESGVNRLFFKIIVHGILFFNFFIYWCYYFVLYNSHILTSFYTGYLNIYCIYLIFLIAHLVFYIYSFTIFIHYIENEQSTLEQTRNKFSILEEEIGVSISEISTVSRATEQLNSAKNMIINAVSDLSAISQETAATNQEVTASIATIKENVDQVSSNSDRLNELSDELKESVAYFK